MRAVVLILITACTVPPPFHVLETAETLRSRQVSMTAGAGGGTGDIDDCCVGAAARVRVGIGHHQEIGVDGNVLAAKNDTVGGIKLAYKLRPREGVALVAGPGFMVGGDTGERNALGGDVGAIVSTSAGGSASVYGALKLAVAVPLRDDIYELGGVSESLVPAVGIAYPLGAQLRLFGEAGGIGSLSQSRDSDKMVDSHTALGWYGAIAVTFTP